MARSGEPHAWRELLGEVSECNRRLKSLPWHRAGLFLHHFGLLRVRANVVSYNSLLKTLGGRWQRVLRWRKRMEQWGLRADLWTQNTVAAACSEWRRTLSLHKSGDESDAFSCSARINACGSGGEWRRAMSLLSSGCSRANVVCQGAAVKAMERSEEWAMAFQILGSKPNLVMYNAALSASAWPHTLSLLASMQAALRPDTVSLNAAAARSRWPRALRLLEGLGPLQRTAVSLGVAVAGTPWRGALAAEATILAEGCGLDVVSHTAAVQAAAVAEQWPWALWLATEVLPPADAVTCAALSSCNDRWQLALDLLPATPQVALCNAALSACEKAWCMGLEWFKGSGACFWQAQQWRWALLVLSAFETHGLQPDLITFNAAMAACEKGSQWQLCFSILAEIQAVSLVANLITYNAALTACANCLLWLRALSLFGALGAPNVLSYAELLRSKERPIFEALAARSGEDLRRFANSRDLSGKEMERS